MWVHWKGSLLPEMLLEAPLVTRLRGPDEELIERAADAAQEERDVCVCSRNRSLRCCWVSSC